MLRYLQCRTLCIGVIVSFSMGCKKNDKSVEKNLLVFAAASLNDVFTSIANDFEAKNKTNVEISFAGSQSLRTQIENGAKPDVFASANASHIKKLVAQKLANGTKIFALNQMVIAVSKKQKAKLSEFKELINIDKLVLAGTSVPAGEYAEKILKNAEKEYGESWLKVLESKVVSRETHVRQTLQKVILGEADAAIVYATDVASTMENIEVVSIPSRFNVQAEYPIAQIGNEKNSQAVDFINFLSSPIGREKLQLHGFTVPD